MATIPACRIARRHLGAIPSDAVFPFLAPSLQASSCASHAHIAKFSTSTALWKRDNNRNRGVSAVRATGPRPRQTLSVINGQPLPQPRPETEVQIRGDEEHGLYGFFRDKKLLTMPADNNKHGRAWTKDELRTRSWDDLHSLWWACVKERNRLHTEAYTLKTIGAYYGQWEIDHRDAVKTMKVIRETLLERFYAWEDARKLAEQDPDVDMAAAERGEPAYNPQYYSSEEMTPDDGNSVNADGKGLAKTSPTAS
ncbi:hypothetical protein BCR34DRAFT_369984 [Clohesyomyces aquaticus]|uniref:Large ribosomal subunit protein uL29m n=1 Tax=Clohesyomyces aquaticus TaxID=1231657 RepID=A0A1Y1ZI66_9PLEO|nr:hypothetical protein BCR34DRAFT_369984 [Clohesyomyces aquaticus]